ncbi:hypothetical protein ES705_25110 [subsurface metagenome]
MDLEKDLMTFEDVARVLRMKPKSVQKLCKRENLSFRIGKRAFIRKETFIKYLEKKEREAK